MTTMINGIPYFVSPKLNENVALTQTATKLNRNWLEDLITPIVGQYYAGLFSVTVDASTGRTYVADTLYASQIFIPITITIDQMATYVMTGSAGSMRLGIYNDDGTGQLPGTLLLDAGTLDCTAAGAKTVACSQQLTRGLYWVAGVSDVTPKIQRIYNGYCSIRGFGSQWANGSAVTCSLTYGALPASFGAATNVGSLAGDFITLRIASVP